MVALLEARRGTAGARGAAAVAIAASLAAVFAWRWVARRRVGVPENLLRGIARGVDPARADRALRALSLVGPTGHATGGVSDALARLHVARAIAELPSQRILERATRVAGRVGVAALVAGLGVAALAIANAWSVIEGGDVLVARGGVAPMTMRWLDGIELTARPPDYLHETEVHEVALTPLALPFGTQVTVRGAPLHAGRRLLLSDGVTEVPFVEDGAGAVVARWSLAETATLRVVARFGGVVIPASDDLPLQSIRDEVPVVALGTAPRQVRLVDETDDIPIRYRATDDHGLREVHLVLRSGVREERRVLARLDGETTTDEGGRALRLRDPFVRRSHAPVEVTVEAKDNDPLNGPKWGVSSAITIIPPDVGEPQARRLAALRRLRDALTDSVAWRLRSAADVQAPGAAERTAHATAESKRASDDEALMDAVMSDAYAGIRIASRSRSLLTVQREKVRKAVDAEARRPGVAAHAATVEASERFVLVADAIVRGLGIADTRDSAKELADVADDLATGAGQTQADASETRSRGAARMDAATLVLLAGGRTMLDLGPDGRDLGEIVQNDCARVKRARDGADPVHAELAARDLAARLRQPDPSFSSHGSGRRAGSESGGSPGSPDDEPGAGDDVDQAFNEAAGDLERLAQDHAGATGKTEQALAGAASDEDQQGLRDEARRHAQAIRDAARPLPAVGGGDDSWSSKGAAARELAEQAARSLEEVRPDEAAQAGRNAMNALDEAKRLMGGGDRRGAWSVLRDPDGEDRKDVDEARRKLEGEVRWAEDQAHRMRRAAAQRARGDLERGGEEEEGMAGRAHDLVQRARERGSLPQNALESIDDAERAAHQAADALKAGDAERGLDRQREAQRALETAREKLHDDEGETGDEPHSPGNADDGRATGPGPPVDIPKEHKGPEEFRRRVVRGLGQASGGALRDAVQRYAEGLLR